MGCEIERTILGYTQLDKSFKHTVILEMSSPTAQEMDTLQVHPSNGTHEKKHKSPLIRIRSWGKKDKDRKSPVPTSDDEGQYLSASPSTSDKSGTSPHSPGLGFKGFKWNKKGKKSPKSPRKPVPEIHADGMEVEPEPEYHPMCELGLTQQQISEFKDAFTLVDKDGDGRITTAELSDVMLFLKSPVSQEQVEVMIDQADIDGNGTVEFDEFLKMMARRQREEPKSSDDEMREFFKVFDRDGNGFIDPQELRYTMKNLGEHLTDEELKSMIKAADLDGDGRINYEEFIRMMQVKQENA